MAEAAETQGPFHLAWYEPFIRATLVRAGGA